MTGAPEKSNKPIETTIRVGEYQRIAWLTHKEKESLIDSLGARQMKQGNTTVVNPPNPDDEYIRMAQGGYPDCVHVEMGEQMLYVCGRTETDVTDRIDAFLDDLKR